MNAKHIRLYDNGGKTNDRFTCVFTNLPELSPNTYSAVGFSARGVGHHVSAKPGRHLGCRVTLAQLPEAALSFVFKELDLVMAI